MARSGNTDALDGMKALGAVEIAEELDQRFQPTGNIVLRGYVDPHLQYRQHLEAISGYEGSIDGIVEVLIRLFGADNFAELGEAPTHLQQFVDHVTAEGMQHTQSSAICRAHMMLNLVGLSPDGGLAKREKIRNVISDGQHLGLASYCNAFLSADQACCSKAQMIYGYFGSATSRSCPHGAAKGRIKMT